MLLGYFISLHHSKRISIIKQRFSYKKDDHNGHPIELLILSVCAFVDAEASPSCEVSFTSRVISTNITVLRAIWPIHT